MATRNESVGDRREWILHLLYAPDPNGVSQPIYGRTRLMKACFLLDRKLKEKFDYETDFEFFAHKYGPFDKGVYTAIEELEDARMIEIVPDEQLATDDGDKHKLTGRGERKAEESYAHLPGRKQELVEWVKYQQSERPLGALLNYVYSNYPSYTTESELV